MTGMNSQAGQFGGQKRSPSFRDRVDVVDPGQFVAVGVDQREATVGRGNRESADQRDALAGFAVGAAIDQPPERGRNSAGSQAWRSLDSPPVNA